MAYSERLKEVLGEPDGILAGVSGNKAALRVARSGGELSNTTILDMKKGVFGRPESVRTLARAYAEDILLRYRHEIQEAYGADAAATDEEWEQLAEDWLCYIAGAGAYRTPRGQTAIPAPAGVISNEQAYEIARRVALNFVEHTSNVSVSAEFGDALVRAAGARDAATFAEAVGATRDEVENAFAGIVPSRPTLLTWIVRAELSGVAAADLLHHAGAGAWDPSSAIAALTVDLARRYGRTKLLAALQVPDPEEMALMNPAHVRQFIDDLEERLEDLSRPGAWDEDAPETLFLRDVVEILGKARLEQHRTSFDVIRFLRVPSLAALRAMSEDELANALMEVERRYATFVSPSAPRLHMPRAWDRFRLRDAKERVRDYMADLAGDLSAEDIAEAGNIPIQTVRQTLAGEPPGFKALCAVLDALRADRVSRNQIMVLLGHRSWDPHLAFRRRADELLRRLGFVNAPWYVTTFSDPLTDASTPADVERIITELEQHLMDYSEPEPSWFSGVELDPRDDVEEFYEAANQAVRSAVAGAMPAIAEMQREQGYFDREPDDAYYWRKFGMMLAERIRNGKSVPPTVPMAGLFDELDRESADALLRRLSQELDSLDSPSNSPKPRNRGQRRGL
ncbi:MAG: hypothetical protein ACK47B_21660 [Armatimonadota bacterium]